MEQSGNDEALNGQQKAQAIRASVSFAPEIYHVLEDIAQKKKVSMAWVVREAVDKYIADKWPLFSELR